MTHLITPKLNLNGSSANDLIEPRIAAGRFLQQAIDAMLMVMPNGRDYPHGPEGCVADRDEMRRRVGILAEMQDDLRDEALGIKRQEA